VDSNEKQTSSDKEKALGLVKYDPLRYELISICPQIINILAGIIVSLLLSYRKLSHFNLVVKLTVFDKGLGAIMYVTRAWGTRIIKKR
jgi:hypothetical protein